MYDFVLPLVAFCAAFCAPLLMATIHRKGKTKGGYMGRFGAFETNLGQNPCFLPQMVLS